MNLSKPTADGSNPSADGPNPSADGPNPSADGPNPSADGAAGTSRRAKFMPKVPVRRAPKRPSSVKTEQEESEQALPEELRQALLHSQLDGGRSLPGNRSSALPAVRVAFGFGASTLGTGVLTRPVPAGPPAPASAGGAGVTRATGAGPAVGGGGKGQGRQSVEEKDMKGLLAAHHQLGSTSTSGVLEHSCGPRDLAADVKPPKEYLDHSRYYPAALPLAPPPSIPEAVKFRSVDDPAVASATEQAEPHVPPADELGLQALGRDGQRLFFLQLPVVLPQADPTAAPSDPEGAAPMDLDRLGPRGADDPEPSVAGEGAAAEATDEDGGERECLGALPPGFVGKLLVYEDGSLRLRLGDVILEAVPGARPMFCQEVVAMSPGSGSCFFLGSAEQRVVLEPDVDHLLQRPTLPGGGRVER